MLNHCVGLFMCFIYVLVRLSNISVLNLYMCVIIWKFHSSFDEYELWAGGLLLEIN